MHNTLENSTFPAEHITSHLQANFAQLNLKSPQLPIGSSTLGPTKKCFAFVLGVGHPLDPLYNIWFSHVILPSFIFRDDDDDEEEEEDDDDDDDDHDDDDDEEEEEDQDEDDDEDEDNDKDEDEVKIKWMKWR